MKKRSLALTDPQMNWLQKRARDLGISVADFLRRLIDEARAHERAVTKGAIK